VKVECVLTNPLLVEHVGPVLRVLQQRGVNAAFVASPPAKRFVHERRRKLELYERCVAAAGLADLPCSSECDPRAQVALTALGSNQLHLYTGTKLKVRYGVTLHRAALHHNLAMSYGFDGMLVHGAFERELFSRWIAPERIRMIGMPRHAAYLARPLTQHEARAQLGLEAGRAVIAYLPTWSVQSSLRSFVTSLATLASSHSLVIKPHALSLAHPHERAALHTLMQRGARVLPQHTAFSQLVAAADLVLADATSGAATEAALLAPSTPLVLLSLRTPTELFREIEQLGRLVCDPGALPGVVAHQLQNDQHRAERSALCARLFYSESAGARAPELAADAVLELMRLPKISGRPGRLERAWPRAARVARGRVISLAIKWAPVLPRDVASRATLPTAAKNS
jgi:hypothetical protein